MISVQEARYRIIASIHTLGAELTSLREAHGRVLAKDTAACIAHPQVAISAMDGYAIRAADVMHIPATLMVVGQSTAGHQSERGVGPGEAIRIFTGAAVPDGADAVVLQEKTETDLVAKVVIVLETVAIGDHIRPAGLDFEVDDILLRSGRLLTFRDIALAASMNVPWLSVVRKPRVAILSTGDEIRLPGESIGATDLIGSNGLALAAFVASNGGIAIDIGIARDNRSSLVELISAARGVDLLLISGGVSVGEYDLVLEVLSEVGFVLDFWKVAIRPGSPLVSGHLAGMPVIGLPGNPVSAMVGAILFVLPVINTFLGLPAESGIKRRTGVLACNLPVNDARESYLRAICVPDGTDEVVRVTPFAQQDSAMQTILATANCLAIRPPCVHNAKIGDAIEVIML